MSRNEISPLFEQSDHRYTLLVPMDNKSTAICNDTDSTASTVRQRQSFFRRLFWPAAQDYSITTPQERKFVRKLDLILMSYGCVSYCIKQIDQSNYMSAYVSGMKEDVCCPIWIQ